MPFVKYDEKSTEICYNRGGKLLFMAAVISRGILTLRGGMRNEF